MSQPSSIVKVVSVSPEDKVFHFTWLLEYQETVMYQIYVYFEKKTTKLSTRLMAAFNDGHNSHPAS